MSKQEIGLYFIGMIGLGILLFYIVGVGIKAFNKIKGKLK